MKILLHRLTAPGLLVAAVLLAGCPLPGPVKDTSLWTISSSAPFVSQPVAMGSSVLAVDFHGRLFSVNPLTGKKNWTYETGERVVFSPVVDSAGDIYIHTGTDFIIKLRPDADGTGVSRLWSTEQLAGESARTASDAMDLIGDTIYRYNTHYKQLSTFSAESGALIAHYILSRYSNSPEDSYVSNLYPIGSNDIDFLVTWNDGIFTPYKNGLPLAQFQSGVSPQWDDQAAFPANVYSLIGKPFVYAGNSWLLFGSRSYVWDEELELPVQLLVDGFPIPSETLLCRLTSAGIDFAGGQQIDVGQELSQYLGFPSEQWFSGQTLNLLLDPYWSPIVAMIDMSDFSFETVNLPLLSEWQPGSSGTIFKIFPVEGNDLFFQVQMQKQDDSPFLENSWFMYRLPGVYTATGPESPESLAQLVANILAPALMSEGMFVVPYGDNTLRGYAHNFSSSTGTLRSMQTSGMVEALQ